MKNIKFNEYLSKQLNDHKFKVEFDKEMENLKNESVIKSSLSEYADFLNGKKSNVDIIE